MRFILIIASLFIYSVSLAGNPDTASIRKAANELDQALLERDSAALHRLLHDKLSYGHSNGWIETKRDVIEDLFNGKLAYSRIEQEGLDIVEEGNTASVRTNADVVVRLEGKEIVLKLHVLQVWIREKKGWVLISRQSTRI